MYKNRWSTLTDKYNYSSLCITLRGHSCYSQREQSKLFILRYYTHHVQREEAAKHESSATFHLLLQSRSAEMCALQATHNCHWFRDTKKW